jgi:hypothetical protein
MRAQLRHAIVSLRAAGFAIDRVHQAGRHTEVHFIDANGGGLVRVHRGNRISAAFERNLRTIIRQHLRAGAP